MENVRRDRTIYRAKFIPIDELYSKVIIIASFYLLGRTC